MAYRIRSLPIMRAGTSCSGAQSISCSLERIEPLYTGDVANKIGTYLKALAAQDSGVPFYVALPSSSFDWTMRDGLAEIPIEERGAEEVKHADGWADGRLVEVR